MAEKKARKIKARAAKRAKLDPDKATTTLDLQKQAAKPQSLPANGNTIDESMDESSDDEAEPRGMFSKSKHEDRPHAHNRKELDFRSQAVAGPQFVHLEIPLASKDCCVRPTSLWDSCRHIGFMVAV